jgi:hypothetical protein
MAVSIFTLKTDIFIVIYAIYPSHRTDYRLRFPATDLIRGIGFAVGESGEGERINPPDGQWR